MAMRRDEITTTTTKTPVPGPLRWWLLLLGLLAVLILLTWGFVATVRGATQDAARQALDAAGLGDVEITGGTYRDLELSGPAGDEDAARAALDGIDLPYDIAYEATAPEPEPEPEPTEAAEPEPSETAEPEVVELADLPDLSGIQFESGSSTLAAGSDATLDAAAAAIIEAYADRPGLRVSIEGHTDNTGGADINLALSQERAEAVRAYLEGAGVPAQIMSATGFGQTQPIADNETAEGRAENRRVDFVITEG